MSAIDTWLAGGTVLAELHIPEGRASTTGVVICPPVAQEHILAYRTLRLLAEQLEASGVAAVRFDYPGFGDSTAAGHAHTPSEGIVIAARALREAGCADIVYLGLSVGALFAQEAARADADAAGLVLWDPVRSGRAWLRRARMLYATSVDGASLEPNPNGTVNIVGGELDQHTVDLLQRLSYEPPTGSLRVLTAVRRCQEGEVAGWAAGTPSSDSRRPVISVDGQEQLLDVSSVIAHIPGSSVGAVHDWILGEFGPQNGSVAALHPEHPETVAVFDSGDADPGPHAQLTEELVRIGPDHLFAVETRMSDTPADAPALILQTGSAEHRVGPARYQVLQARQLATRGYRVLRVDRRGAGESGNVAADEPNLMYAQEWIDDNARAIRWLGLPPERVGVVGICVGGWLALKTEPSLARMAITLNTSGFRVRPAAPGYVLNDALGPELGEEAMKGRVKRALGPVVPWFKRILPYWAMGALGRLGLIEIVELALRPPMVAGCDIVLLMSPLDQFAFTQKLGQRAVARLGSSDGSVTIVNFDEGDHPIFEASFRGRVLDEVSAQVDRRLGHYVPGHVGSEKIPVS